MSNDLDLAFVSNAQSLDDLFQIDEALLTDITLFDGRLEAEESTIEFAVPIFADAEFEIEADLTADFGGVSLGDISIDYFIGAELDAPESIALG